jgi:hypothetical protein
MKRPNRIAAVVAIDHHAALRLHQALRLVAVMVGLMAQDTPEARLLTIDGAPPQMLAPRSAMSSNSTDDADNICSISSVASAMARVAVSITSSASSGGS